MDWMTLTPLAIPAVIAALSAVALACGTLSAQSEAKHASRVGRIEGAVGRAAGDIAARMRTLEASGTATDVLGELEQAALEGGVAYLRSVLPDTLQAVGASDSAVEAMIRGELGKLKLAAFAPKAAPATLPTAS